MQSEREWTLENLDSTSRTHKAEPIITGENDTYWHKGLVEALMDIMVAL